MPFRNHGTKYNNRRVKCDGYTFDSGGERDRYLQLKEMQAAGLITGLEIKPSFRLVVTGVETVEISRPFRPDFSYYDATGDRRVEDFKGYMDPEDQAVKIFNMKCRLVKALYGIEIDVIQTPEAIRQQERRQARKREQARLRRLAEKAGRL